MTPKTMMIDNVEYIRKEDAQSKTDYSEKGLRAVIVRTYSAGVFYGYLESLEGKHAVLRQARRMWQWFGASLSECAQSGTPDKSKCRFPEAVEKIELTEAIEVLELTVKAKKSLDSVKLWKA